MCSIPGLPTPGSKVSVLITRVNCNPQCDIVELWGNFDQERKIAYQHLRKDIQFPRETFRELEGNPGDVCLVQIYETWYRVRIVSRNGSSYNVFLIDEGRMLGVTTSMLAWGQKEFFHLPPEVEFCVLSNVLPVSPENRWSPVALEFLKSLCGKTVDACVQDILVPHRTFLLDVPCVSRQMHEMGFAKKLSTDKFKLYVSKSLQSGASNSTEYPQKSSVRNDPLETREQIEKQQHYMYPELQTETVETVIVTEVTNPLRVFCQLKVFSQELKKLTEQITQHYEGRVETGITRPETLGSPCASRASDGRWYRSMLQHVFPANNVVEVLHVDYGKKQFVQVENIRPLATEFFRMPVVTYVCSLHGVIDKGVGWTAAQIEYLKSLLLNRTVIAKFEYQSLSEGVHYVTLYGNENTNINKLFGTKERCLLDSEKVHGDYAVRNNCASPPHPDGIKFQETAPPNSGDPMEIKAKYHAEDLPLNSSHVAVVQHVENPSEFWIHTQMYADAFNQMMNDLADLYSNPVSAGVVECPKVGLYCAARSQDNSFYRATVSEVTGNKARVFFFDYGNTEMIDWFNLGVLPDKFKELPALALKCRLAGIRPKEEKWSRNATDFFTKSIADKILDVHVTAKSHGAYIVQLMDSSAHGERDVSKLLCNAGYAEKGDTSKTPHKASSRPIIAPTTQSPQSRTAFKEYLFPIGSSVEANVSYIESPNDFWCQLAQNSNHLKWLMQDIQQHYADTEFGQPVEPACVARHPDNGMWYRALVIQKHATLHVDVLFIDYGQTKTVSLQDLRRIDPNFMQLKGQAFRCSLYNLILPTSHTTEWPEDAIRQFHDFVDTAASDHRVLKCTIYAVMYNAQKVVFNVVDLETPFQSVCNLMVQKGLANQVSVTSVKNVNHFYCQLKRNADTVKGLAETINTLCRQLEITNYLPSKSINPGMVADVFVSHCNSPQSFFVQLIKEEDDIYSIVEKLNVEQSTAATIHTKDLSQGDLVNAEFPDDSSWYRAVVSEILGNETALVEFIDFGNTATVSVSKICQLDKHFLEIPRFSIHCFLSGVTTVGNQAELNPEVVSNFKEKVGLNGNKRLGCMFMKQSGSFWEVGLTSEGSNQEAEEPQQSPSARIVPPEMSTLVDVKTARYSKPDISEGQTVEVYASTINGPQSFWCQSAESDKLDKITEVVADAGNAVASTLIDMETLCTGSPCIALFVDDEQWYRAEVLRKDGDALSILFVDYGNESTVNLKAVRPMPTVLIDTPPQAFQCQLEGFDYSQGSWHDTAADQLSELIKDKLLHLTVMRVSSQKRGGITCFLKVKCEEEMINDTMKLYWKSSIDKVTSEDEDKSDPTGVAMSGDTPSLVGEFKLVEEAAAVPNSSPEEPYKKVREHDTDYALAHSETHELLDEDKCTDISDEQQDSSVLTQATDEGHAEDVDLISFQVDADCFDHLGNTESIDDDKEEEKQSYTNEIQESMTAIQVLSAKTPNEGIETKSIPIIIICEEPSDAGLECVSESGVSCEAQVATSQGNKDILVSRTKKDTLEVDKDESGSVSVLEKAFSLDDSESRLYFDEHFDQTSLSIIYQGQDDIYEEVFKLCAEPVAESAKSEHAVTEESETKDEELETLALELETKKEESGIRDEDVNISAVVAESEFGKLQRVELTVPVGSSSCVVWSSAKKSWCKAKILKIFEDSIKVLLLDHDTEMIVDPHNIFEPLSSETEETRPDFDTASSNAGSERDHEDTDDSDNTVAGDDLSKAASEVQDDSTLADVCAPLDESSDVISEQLVDTEPATDVEVVSRVPTQDNKDDDVLEEDSCLREVTSCPIGDGLVTSTDDGAEIKKATCADGISSATPQERDDLLGESKSSPDEDCLVSTEQRTDAQEAIVVEVTSSAPTQDKDDLLCHEEVCSDCAEQFAEIEEVTDVEVVSSAATQDKNDVQLEQEMSFPGEDSAEVVMSQVTHLSLRVEENSDDDVIFVSEIRTTQEQSQSSD
ncbi:unnamed protein product [Oncorhynchus mykiss]|uniref:Tudor domain-containing protein n=1 Tax=Oncorhynchus mykiss TaxID=8022 RepID=A0A060XUH3_ONCMY|nr:unnamed protein product [Oncorhynchus mykiss]